MPTRRLVLALIVSSLVACGDHPVTPAPDAAVFTPDAAPRVWTAEDVCAAISAQICDRLDHCGCRFDLRPYDKAGCAAVRTSACVASFADRVKPDLQEGRARLDGPTIDGCLASITCAQPASNQLPHACDMIILATAAIGAPCALTSGGLAYCADGLGVCAPGDSGAICTALPGDGAECAYGLCAPGLACTTAGTCGAPGAIGTTCLAAGDCAPTLVCPPSGQCAAPLGEGATCTDYHQCGDGLTCVAGTCATAPTIGGACASQDQCGADLGCGRTPEARTCDDPDPQGGACTDGSCALGLGCSATTMTCAALPGAGDPCLDGFACAAGLTCADGLGTCVTLPGNGETCAVGNRFCADGLGCDPSDNTCRPGPGLDQPCLLNPPDYVCGAGLACDFGANGSTCVPIGGAGAACNSDRTCGTGTYCDFSTLRCTPRKANGEGCSDGNECATGSECAPTANGFQCAPIPGRAEPCQTACTAGLACKGLGGTCMPPICLVP